MNNYLRVLLYIRPYRARMGIVVVLTLGFSLANILFLPLVRDIVSEMSNKNLTNFSNQIINCILLYGLRMATLFGRFFVMTWISEKVLMDIRLDAFKKVTELPHRFFSEWKTGDVIQRIIGDTDRIRLALMTWFWEVVPNVITFIGIVIYLFVLNWKLMLFTISAVPLFLFGIAYLSRTMKRVARQTQRNAADINHITQEVLSNISMVQSYTMGHFELNRFKRECVRNFNATIKGASVSSRVEPLIGVLQFLVIVAVIWYGGYEMASGAMSGPTLAAFFSGMILLIDPVLALSKMVSTVQQGTVSAERVFEILDYPDPFSRTDVPVVRDRLVGKVDFDGVKFRYDATLPYVLRNLTLSVAKGEMVAIVGLSGAGKTTLVNLLPRFFDATSGEVRIDDVPVSAFDLTFLRQNIGIVPQDDLIFRGTILENIRYGRQKATQADVEFAARQAHAWEFIERLPDRMLTKVGDRGITLSGGQKQRISIARAILKDPAILILDEATSALDSESEKLVQAALTYLMKGRTTFVVAHRLSTIVHADKIVVMERGEVIEVGTHDTLIAKGGAYSRLYSHQFKDIKAQ